MTEPQSKSSCAVIGNPIKQSLSPNIHQRFAQQYGLSLDYLRILGEEGRFEQQVSAFFENGGRGMNVTTPFKKRAFKMADIVSVESEKTESCNTLWFQEGVLHGCSTDGAGWLADLNRLDISLQGKKVLLLGAGGASRVILEQLLASDLSHLTMANRSLERLVPLQSDARMDIAPLDNIKADEYDLLISGLSVGWGADYPEIHLDVSDKTLAYDLNYGAGAAAFKSWFLKAGGSTECFYDGWGMLVNQAALSFEIWFERKPEVDDIIKLDPSGLKGSD